MASNEARELGADFREMYGPKLYTWWLHRDTKDGGTAVNPRRTIIEIHGWLRYGESESTIEASFFSLNGTTNNREYSDGSIPEKLRHLSIDDFWSMVVTGEIRYLDEQAHVMQESQPSLDGGDGIPSLEQGE